MQEAPKLRATTLLVAPEHCVGMIGGLLFLVAQTEPNEDLLRQQTAWAPQMKAAGPGGSAFVIIIPHTMRPPSEASRTVIRKALQEFEKLAVAGVLVVEGQGFAGAAIRSVVSMLIMAARIRYPLKSVATIRDASAWVVPQLRAGSLTVDDAALAMEEMKREYQAGRLAPTGG